MNYNFNTNIVRLKQKNFNIENLYTMHFNTNIVRLKPTQKYYKIINNNLFFDIFFLLFFLSTLFNVILLGHRQIFILSIFQSNFQRT